MPSASGIPQSSSPFTSKFIVLNMYNAYDRLLSVEESQSSILPRVNDNMLPCIVFCISYSIVVLYKRFLAPKYHSKTSLMFN